MINHWLVEGVGCGTYSARADFKLTDKRDKTSTESLFHCATVPLCLSSPVLLSHCPTVCLFHSATESLFHSARVFHSFTFCYCSTISLFQCATIPLCLCSTMLINYVKYYLLWLVCSNFRGSRIGEIEE